MRVSPAGQEVPLTGMKFCLLETMMAGDPSQATSRRTLVEAMGYDYLTFDAHRLEVRIRRLRKKSATSQARTIRSSPSGALAISFCPLQAELMGDDL